MIQLQNRKSIIANKDFSIEWKIHAHDTLISTLAKENEKKTRNLRCLTLLI